MTSRYLKYIDKIAERLLESNPEANTRKLYDAFHLANNAHKNDFRRSGDPYIEHPVMVAHILSEMNVDETTLIAALLHDTVEDTSVSNIEIEEEFGKNVSVIVEGVTKISEITFESLEQKQAENYRKLIISMIKDLRVIIIKFADRLHNMRTIKYMKPHKQVQKAKETMEVFAPLAYRLGMYKIKSELEDKAFEVLYPEDYKHIENQLDAEKDDYEKLLNNIIPEVQELVKKNGIKAKINGRVKHFYSIFRKLQTRKDSIEQIKDIVAIRIIIDSEDEDLCFKTMRLIHRHYTSIESEFSNFIDKPRENGYKSLHSKIIYMGQISEVQIRTKKMHEIAEYGLAAHWRYKNQQGNSSKQAIDEYIDKLKNILNLSFESSDPNEVLEELRINLISGEIFVFTPQRELIHLPIDSTPIDFAYKIHENIGNQCIAAKVSGKIVPLHKELENGDVVEIITSKNQHPSYEWLNFAKSSKARRYIKNYLKKKQFDRTINLGDEILQSEMKKYRINLSDEKLMELSNSFGYKNENEFYFAIGSGDIKPREFLRKVADDEKSSLLEKVIGKVMFKKEKKGVRLNNVSKKNLSFCSFCNPLPGDPIIGCDKGVSGIIIHRTNCKIIKSISEKEQLDVFWDADKDEYFETKISIVAENRKDLLKDIIGVVSRAKINLQSVRMESGEGLATGEFLAEVKNLNQYIKIRKKISSIEGVISVSRNLELKEI